MSANADEKDIENWVKITDTQDSNNKLQFVIDSRNVSNYKEIESEDVTYIYIKEVATKGENQSTVISNSMKLETNNNVETYVDDVKKENLQEEIDNLNENLCLIQDTLEEQEEKAKKYDKFVAGLEAFTKEHPEQAAAFREEVAYILDYTQPEVDLSIEEER